jgi:predicted transcriptional regulator
VADYPVFLEDSKKKNRLYRTLSDHYGLSVEIHIKDSKVLPSLESQVKHKSDDCVLDIIDENVKLLVEN